MSSLSTQNLQLKEAQKNQSEIVERNKILLKDQEKLFEIQAAEIQWKEKGFFQQQKLDEQSLKIKSLEDQLR